MSQSFSVRDHHAHAAPVYDELARIDGGLTTANADKNKWYLNEYGGNGPGDGRARPVVLSSDRDRLDIGRNLYVSINYTPADYFMGAWRRFRWPDGDGDREWWVPGRETWTTKENPMPDYHHLTAIAPLVDADLTDDVKASRAGGEFPQATVERALDAWIEGMAELCGGRGPVHALDSVGGAYVMVAPSVTRPISREFDGAERGQIFAALSGRVNDHATAVRDRVHAEIDGLDGLMDPDMVTHKNRLHKAPLTLHDDIDGVVTPLDTDAPDYSLTPISATDDALVDAAVEWAESYTDDYSGRVRALVAALWPEYADGQTWDDALREWLDDQQADPEPDGEATSASSSTGEIPDYADTASRTEVYKKLDSLGVEDVAGKTIVKHWTADLSDAKDRSASGHEAIVPTWAGGYESGNATYIDTDQQIFHDTDAGQYGTIIEMALIASDDYDWDYSDGIAKGADWVNGIRALRSLGYDVPLPQGDDLDDDASPYYSVDLKGIAGEYGVSGDPYSDDDALLKACLYAREQTPPLADEKPPYAALRAVAELAGLNMEDADEGVLGKAAYKVATRIFGDLSPEELS